MGDASLAIYYLSGDVADFDFDFLDKTGYIAENGIGIQVSTKKLN